MTHVNLHTCETVLKSARGSERLSETNERPETREEDEEDQGRHIAWSTRNSLQVITQ